MATGTSYRTPGALPPQPSELVGREAAVARTRELLRGSRLVTITGTGGVGKTRLAVRAAGEAAADYRDGAHFIELSAVRDPDLLVHSLATAFTVSEVPGGAPGPGTQLDNVLSYLRERELLLVLDTCEHVLDACAALADTVLREAPGVTILATSRQPFDADGEAVQVLYPLPVPGAEGGSGAGRPGEADAVELFARRAATAVHGFTVTPQNIADVVAICKGLDGIPLAIELATVRLRALPLHEMAERIADRLRQLTGDRLRLLTGERRSGAQRHQTLRAAIEWSYELCTQAEQLLWTRLSVFADGFAVDAAEEICADSELPANEVVSAIFGLVEKNVLTRHEVRAPDGEPGAPRFRMLDTLREFGAERLHAADKRAVVPWRTSQAAPGLTARVAPEIGQAVAAVRGRFIAYYLGLAEEFEADPVTGQVAKLQRLSRDHANLRAAFEYALELPGNDGGAILIATSLTLYWHMSSQLREGEYWLDQAFERCPKRSVVRARVLAARAYVRIMLNDYAHGIPDAQEAIAMAAPFNDVGTAGRAHEALCMAYLYTGNVAEGQAAQEAATEYCTTAGDVHGLARLALIESRMWRQAGDLDQSYDSAAKGLGQLPEDEVWVSSLLYGCQCLVLFLRGDVEGAMTPGLLALMMKQQIQDLLGIALGLSVLGCMAASQGRCQRTAWLFGAAAPLWARAGQWYSGDPGMQALHEVAERAARAALGDDRYWALRAVGESAPLDRAVARALADADDLDVPA
jgi:non-specific serine/threonine protein kinase